MPTFTLKTNFTQDSLTMLYATGTNIVVAKPTPVTALPTWPGSYSAPCRAIR